MIFSQCSPQIEALAWEISGQYLSCCELSLAMKLCSNTAFSLLEASTNIPL